MSIEWQSLEPSLSHPDNDKRIQGLNSLKELLEQQDESSPISDSDQLATLLKASLKSNNSHVSNAALSLLPLYFSHLPPSPLSLKHALLQLLPGLLEKLGDTKLQTREWARASLENAARVNLGIGLQSASGKAKEPIWTMIEDGIKENGFHSKNAKAREQALLFLLAIRTPSSSSSADSPLPPLKPFTPLLLPLLADSDPSVRSTALSTTISIFSSPLVNTTALSALKKEMTKLDLPKKVQDHVLQSVLSGGNGTERSTTTTSQASSSENGSISTTPQTSGPATRTRTRAAVASSSSNNSTPSVLSSLPSAAFPSDPTAVHTSTSTIEPVYLASIQDMKGSFERMKPCFEGKETEFNWIERDKSIGEIRGMLVGGVGERDEEEWKEEFVKCIKEVQDGIIKTSSSLRTTLAISALTLLTTLSTSLPPPLLDSILDPFLPHTLSMSSQTKKIVASASQSTVESFITHSSYHHKTTQLLLIGMSDKVVQARQYYSSHLYTFLRVHGKKSKNLMDSTGGTKDLEEGIKKGLLDPNAGVRENSRKAFWEFSREWETDAEGIREGLDSQAKKLLDKVRPTGDEEVETKVVNGGNGLALRKSVRGKAPAMKEEAGEKVQKEGKKPTVRELMLAAKRKKLAEEEEAASKEREREQEQEQEVEEPTPTTTPSKPPLPSNHSTPSRPTPHSVDESSPLQDVSSPFTKPSLLPSEEQQETPFRSSQPRSRPTPSTSSRTPVNLPILEPVVDESLKEQASQAEQTAERLLEIAQEEEESQSRSISTTTPRPIEKGVRVGAMQTPIQRNGGGLLFGRKGGNDVFRDSPDMRDGNGGGGKGIWWERKNRVAAQSERSISLPVDSQERTDEIDSLISGLQSLEIDSNDMKKLSQLSRERPVREGDEEERGGSAAKWWRDGKRFEKAYEGVRRQLLGSDQAGNTRDMALIVLRDLVEHQFACFSGDEAGVFELLLRLREDPSRTTIAATEFIATSFTSRIEPLYGVGTLCPSLTSYLESSSAPQDAKARSFTLALKLIGGFFESLPAEVLEDVFPQSKDLIKKALNDQSSGDLRRAAINALVSAQSVLRDEKKLTEMIDGLEPDQANLLSYYCAKRGV